MKKISTLLASAMVAMSSMAQTTNTYDCNLAIIVDGTPADKQQMTVTTTKAEDGTYTLQLKNFILYTNGEPMPIGTITVPNITAEIEDGDTLLNSDQNITIAAGDLPGVEMWMGPMLQEIPLELNSTLSDGQLGAILDIPFGQMKISVIVSSATSQLPNSDFSAWHKATYKGFMSSAESDEPNNWHSFMSCTGTLASIVAKTPHTFISDVVRPGSTDGKSVLIVSSSILGQSANGTITTGRLNAGSASADNTDNNSFLDLSNTDVDANGDPFYTKLRLNPDSIAVWMKYLPGDKSANPQATISAILTDGTKYQDPEVADTEYKNVVAKANNANIESKNGEWQRVVVPFDYATYYINDADPHAMLVTISTCGVPGGGSKDNNDADSLYVDGVELIYNSQLSNVMVNERNVEGFDKDTYEYNITVDALPEAEDIECEELGEGAMAFTTMVDNTAYINVVSEDLQNINTYKLNFKLSTNGIKANKANTNTVATYGINGVKTSDNAKGIVIKKYADGTTRKIVK